jgi:hypothetical protein
LVAARDAIQSFDGSGIENRCREQAPKPDLRRSSTRQVSNDEWDARVNLAAAYRVVALYGWDDLVFTHLSARVPGPVTTS